ncbi:hypothetical protein JOD54_002624 [Actinokineospora baliensis]|uniref:hypothetical protein n=1 Tax=Actinokineospora baliensis TaxID=547056 RepID=UPI00195E6C7F|nr:hypothetical protein [Actinokineospora baliensis]MBM7772420.1 hypothetical protein [Actinokineospora baliensis]
MSVELRDLVWAKAVEESTAGRGATAGERGTGEPVRRMRAVRAPRVERVRDQH